MTPKSQALLILGPHRSGTSAFTRVANLLGVDLGREMLSPKFDNPQGYWEHREVFEFHERLLSRAGSAWHDYRPMPEDWRERAAVRGMRHQLLEILEQEFGDSPLWGVKDPRMCRLLPLWLGLLETLEVAPKFVILVRNPLEVVDSLQKRDGFSRSKALLLYLADLLAAIHHTEGFPRVFVSYTGLLADWRTTVEEIARRLPLEWPRLPAVAGGEIDAFLNPSARHHRHGVADLRDTPAIPEWVATLYEAVEEASRGEPPGLPATLRQVRDQFTAACALFLPELNLLMDEVARVSHPSTALQEEQTRLEHRAHRAEVELAKVQKHLTSILSSPLYRFSRGFRRIWRRIKSFR